MSKSKKRIEMSKNQKRIEMSKIIEMSKNQNAKKRIEMSKNQCAQREMSKKQKAKRELIKHTKKCLEFRPCHAPYWCFCLCSSDHGSCMELL